MTLFWKITRFFRATLRTGRISIPETGKKTEIMHLAHRLRSRAGLYGWRKTKNISSCSLSPTQGSIISERRKTGICFSVCCCKAASSCKSDLNQLSHNAHGASDTALHLGRFSQPDKRIHSCSFQAAGKGGSGEQDDCCIKNEPNKKSALYQATAEAA
ncbi:MAG: hypothetical protein ACI4V3_10100 [Faecousia sp.]